MAERINIVGEVDGKPMANEMKVKVEGALKTALQQEISAQRIVGTHHYSVTHLSIVVDE